MSEGQYRGYAMLRVYTGGKRHGQRELVQRGLTLEETRDEKRWPLGIQEDDQGNRFVYSHIHQEFAEK